MLTKEQRSLIKSLHKKSGREETGLCLVEGENALEMAGNAVQETFTHKDTLDFSKLVSLKTNTGIAGIAKAPSFTEETIQTRNVLLVLDNLQDPGNMGTLFRLAFAFDASIICIGGADPLSPKVIRSSTGTIFRVPWKRVESLSEELTGRTVYKLEKSESATSISEVTVQPNSVLVIGSEGNGIQSEIEGESVFIPHHPGLDSLNAATAGAIALWELNKAPR